MKIYPILSALAGVVVAVALAGAMLISHFAA
jgi:hypothetical protein